MIWQVSNLPTTKITGASEPAGGPVTVKSVSPNADGGVIPQGSRKDAPGIRKRIPRDNRSAFGIEMRRMGREQTCLPTE